MSWRIYLASLLIVLGILALLGNFGFLSEQAWIYALPVALVLSGTLLLWKARRKPYVLQTVTASASVENAARAIVNFKHGAGRMKLTADHDAACLLSGTFSGGVTQRISRDGDTVKVELKTPSEIWDHLSEIKPRGLEWNVSLNGNIPVTLQYEGGAGEAQMDLSGNRLIELDLQTGASPTHVILPLPRGTLRFVIHSGAAPVHVRVPPGACVSIRGAPGLGLLETDTSRFPDRGFGILQSDGYAEAADRIEVTIEGGIGPVEIH